MNKTELKQKLDELDELREIRKFLSHYNEEYIIKLKRKYYWFGDLIVYKRNLKISKDVMLNIVKELIIYYENDIDKVLGGSDE